MELPKEATECDLMVVETAMKRELTREASVFEKLMRGF